MSHPPASSGLSGSSSLFSGVFIGEEADAVEDGVRRYHSGYIQALM
jgi:hypothetical protein